MKKVAFVVQRCGLEVNGGAETLCFTIAQQMSKHWDVEVLSTCALDYVTWKNHYSPGLVEVSGVKVRRFSVQKQRDINKFNSLSNQICSRVSEASIKEQEAWMREQGPLSPDLISYVKNYQHKYDAFIFFTYLYATTYFVLPLVAEKAYLAACAHDEWTIHMSMWDIFFKKPRSFIFNTLEEKAFLKKRFPKANLTGPVAGIAVEPPSTYNVKQFREKYQIYEPFFLYVGRIDPSKGCQELFDYFINLRKEESSSKKLVLLGKATMPIPNHPDILELGFVEEQTKWDALAACDLLIMPSPYESLSIVILEAWAVGKPVLVNGKCDVLVGQCRRSQGGLWYLNEDEFQVAIEFINQKVKNQLGLQGKKFVEKNYIWSKIEQHFLDLVH